LRNAGLAAAALLACLLLAGCGTDDAKPAPSTAPTAAPAPVRTLYVQAPLSGPAGDDGRAMVDAVRLVVDQQGAIAGRVRIVVRALDHGGATAATDTAMAAPLPPPIRRAVPATPRRRLPTGARWRSSAPTSRPAARAR
jgi:hypothetical protein